MIEKLKKMWFLITTIVVLLQTVVTFFFLYLKSESKVLSGIIVVLAGVYILAFLILAVMSAHAKKYSHEALSRFKRSQKTVKRFITLVMLAMNILFIINSRSGFVLAPIVMVLFNLLLLAIDFKMAEIAEKRARKKKQKLREKKQAELYKNETQVEDANLGDYKKHKKKRFFGDFGGN